MPKPASFLDMLSDNPHGWGNLPPMPQDDPYAVTRYQPDEYGTLKDSHGRFPESVDSTPSLSDSLYNIAVSPAQMLVGGVTEPLEAFSRLGHSGTQSPLGVPEYNDANKHDMSTLTMAMFGGQAFNPLRAGEGMAARALSDTGKPSLIGSALAGAEQGQPVRAYHGTNREIKGKLIARGAGFFNDGAQFPATWFTNKPRIASKFADNGSYESPNILPVDINSGNLKEVNYNYLPPNFDHIDETLSAAKAEGFDGVTFKNMADAPGYYNPFNSSNVTAMIKSGHVRSATTGETLFSDTGKPSLMGSALAGAERKNITLDGGRDYLAPQQTPNRYLELAKNHLAHIAGMPMAYGRLREYDGLSMGEAVRNIAGEVPSAIDRIKGQFRDNTAQYRDNIAQRQSRMAERFEYAIKDGDGNQIGTAIGDVDGDTMHLDWLGGKSGDKDILGLSGIRQLREQVRKDFPNVKNFTGYRVSGAKNTNHVSDRRQTVKILSDTGKPSILGSALAGAETVSPRPGPGALIPEAKATGSLIAETDQYRAFIQSVQDRVDNGESGPFYGPRIPHAAADEAIMQNGLNAFRKDIKERQHDYWPEQSFLRHDNPDEWAAVNDHIQKLSNATALQNAGNVPIPAITSALDRAAAAAGQKLYIADDGAFGKSAYGSLETPAGNSYKVRVADHARQSGQHNSADFNVAPGSMTPEEFIRLLPTIYSDTGKPSLMGSALAGDHGQDQNAALMDILKQYGVHLD